MASFTPAMNKVCELLFVNNHRVRRRSEELRHSDRRRTLRDRTGMRPCMDAPRSPFLHRILQWRCDTCCVMHGHADIANPKIGRSLCPKLIFGGRHLQYFRIGIPPGTTPLLDAFEQRPSTVRNENGARHAPSSEAAVLQQQLSISVSMETGTKLGVERERTNIVRGIPAGGCSR